MNRAAMPIPLSKKAPNKLYVVLSNPLYLVRMDTLLKSERQPSHEKDLEGDYRF